MTSHDKMPRVIEHCHTVYAADGAGWREYDAGAQYILKDLADHLADALRPFAKYACAIGYHVGEPPCHNCEARDALAAYEYLEE